MLVRLRGWSDEDVLALLVLFRKHLLRYVYASDSQFAEMVRLELPEKSSAEILEMVRALMHQFGLGLSTKNFRTDVIVTNGQEVYVYEHIYESISQLPENKAGGVWPPDELSRFLQKAKQYRELFADSQDVYFTRVQVWGKSVAETKSKFYVLREIFIREKRRSRQRKEVDSMRVGVLKEIFTGVPPAHRAEKVAVLSKAPKLWSAEDMETLVDFVVRITKQIQATGSSDLVDQVAETLHRTDGSCMNKLYDMREKFLKRSTTVRAANLPDIVFDTTSEAHKIFSADWTDSNDPYALGYLAIKSRTLRLTSERNKKRRSKSIWLPRPKLRSATMAARGAPSATANTTIPAAQDAVPQGTAKPVVKEPSATSILRARQSGVSGVSSSKRTPANRLSANGYAAFVRDIAEHCQWTEKLVHNVLRCMQHAIDLYRSNKLVEFFDRIASLTPGITFAILLAHGQHILTQFEQRFGTLNGFESVDLMVPGTNSPMGSSELETVEQDQAPQKCATDGLTAAADTQTETAKNADEQHELEEVSVGEGEHEQSPGLGSPIPQTGNEDTITNEVEGEHEQSPVPESQNCTPPIGNADATISEDEQEQEQSASPTQTPQTGNEDDADDHSPSTTGKQSSPADIWGEGVDADADLDDDDMDTQSVGSSDNTWSGSSNTSDPKDSHHYARENNNPYPVLGQFASDRSKKPSKRGKDEQYGKNFDLAKKRRLDEKEPTLKDDDEDEGYDDEEDDEDDEDDQSEDMDDDPPPEADSLSSDGEHEEVHHPLQSILNSLDAHIAELRMKQRGLIERKEDREWRQRQHTDRGYDFRMSMQSFASHM